MSQLNIQNINHESNGPLLHKKCTFTFTFQSESHFTFYHQEHVSQWWEHINLATTWRAKLKGAHEHSRRLKFAKTKNPHAIHTKYGYDSHWGLLPYDNHGWKCDLNEPCTLLVNVFSKPEAFLYICLFFNVLNSLFKDIHTREKQHLSLMYAMYSKMSKRKIPSYTHFSCTWYKGFTLGKIYK